MSLEQERTTIEHYSDIDLKNIRLLIDCPPRQITPTEFLNAHGIQTSPESEDNSCPFDPYCQGQILEDIRMYDAREKKCPATTRINALAALSVGTDHYQIGDPDLENIVFFDHQSQGLILDREGLRQTPRKEDKHQTQRYILGEVARLAKPNMYSEDYENFVSTFMQVQQHTAHKLGTQQIHSAKAYKSNGNPDQVSSFYRYWLE